MNPQRPPMPPMNTPGPGPAPAGGPAKPAKAAKQNKQARKSSSRSTRTYLIAAIVLAVFAFGVVMLGTSTTVTTYVFKAKAPVAAGSIVNADMFEAVPVTDTEIVDGAFVGATPEELAEKVTFNNLMVLYPMPKGAMLVQGYLSENALAAPLAQPLKPGERLISISARPSDAVAGSIRVGDRVDIFAVGGATLPVAQLMVADVEVVAVAVPSGELDAVAQQQVSRQLDGAGSGSAKEDLLPGDPLPGVYTVRVTENVATRLLIVNDQATLVLAYRGPDATTATTYTPESLIDALCDTPSVLGDSDGDGLSDDKETELGTDPNVVDTDGDGSSDGDEVNVHNTNPLEPLSAPAPGGVTAAEVPASCLVAQNELASQLNNDPITGPATITEPILDDTSLAEVLP